MLTKVGVGFGKAVFASVSGRAEGSLNSRAAVRFGLLMASFDSGAREALESAH
jgi:hypothetical protein